MKSRILILTAAVLLLVTFSPGKANARGFSPPPPPPPPSCPGKTTTLPINNGADFLIITGMAIGVVAVKKSTTNNKSIAE